MREVECLSWSAAGKSRKEIAQLSPHNPMMEIEARGFMAVWKRFRAGLMTLSQRSDVKPRWQPHMEPRS
ncbi:hypothetical protein [Rhizobium grahamii]|nr:hypothetical protein [Rhizobium grahamii]